MPDSSRRTKGILGGLAGLVGLSALTGVLVAVTVTPAVALASTAASQAITLFDNLPSTLEIDALMVPSNFYATDPDTGEQVLLAKFLEQDRTPVAYDQVASVMYDAILSSEDPRYYDHGGVDIIGTTRAMLSNLSGGGATQGGSTISQQYVKNVLVQQCEATAPTQEEEYDCWSQATTADGTEGVERKLQEMRYAIALEQTYSKDEILIGYLNIANFGGTTYGIEAAARYYFGTTAAQLTLGQSATLAGMVQNPNTYRVDRTGGSIVNADGSAVNKAPDGSVDDAVDGQLAALDSLLADATITQEQYLAAADGYTSTKGRQLYVLSRMLSDGTITNDQYVAAAVEPITPVITPTVTGCAAAGGAAYFCQYVKDTILNDPAFGETAADRLLTLQRGGLNVYTTLDARLQTAAETAMTTYAPTSATMPTTSGAATGRFGSTTVSIEASTGRILSIAQNTTFSEDAADSDDANYSSLVFAGDLDVGGSSGFNAGSTFKLFTLLDWLEQGHSLNESLDGRLRVFDQLTNSCEGDWENTSNTLVNNFGKAAGRVGTPLQFTASSLNTGYFAMAEKLDLCDIQNVAARLGVTQADGEPVTMDNLNSIIGTAAVSPIAMAAAYATVANGGTYCEPQAIDRVTDAEGNEIATPERSCTQALTPEIASTAAYALQSVMAAGGSGAAGNPSDGTAVLGKTGTHEAWQTWLIESSTKVTTATWAGNVQGGGDVFNTWQGATRLSDIRYRIGRAVQTAANDAYGGDAFPSPDATLTRTSQATLPDVTGLSVADAQNRLEVAGFTVRVGDPVDSDVAAGLVAAQDPGAGRVSAGATVTIRASTGTRTTAPEDGDGDDDDDGDDGSGGETDTGTPGGTGGEGSGGG
ncbi:penicillin-binding protein [Microbacterium allomyrinae]|uniref:Penicillin-binding protein n=1 Tax=Microbacterium allomyrinae TaxID=2830666 RepID=A0A9X1S3M2_9MICO|nr:penicillin-binding protein [Microbacterium allomyrinae]MCC2032652.1 penicillin-binding protein [Microbacterium allomyrinae]